MRKGVIQLDFRKICDFKFGFGLGLGFGLVEDMPSHQVKRGNGVLNGTMPSFRTTRLYDSAQVLLGPEWLSAGCQAGKGRSRTNASELADTEALCGEGIWPPCPHIGSESCVESSGRYPEHGR